MANFWAAPNNGKMMSGPAKNARKQKSVSSTSRSEPKRKLTDSERHKRFLDMAREVEASDDPKDFEKAFKKVVSATKHPSSKK
jgi:hypothetical protein